MRRSYKSIVREHIIPRMDKLCQGAIEKKDDLMVEGFKAFGDHVPFAAGTLLKAYTTLVLDNDEDLFNEDTMTKVRDLLKFAFTYSVNTFGILNLLIALYEYKKAGLLNRLLNKEDLEKIEKKLDWRIFVNETTMELKNGLPFNYYSVAYRIAKLREKLGFESENSSLIFLEIYLKHSTKYSKNGWYMDETMGKGRFDRYTTIVPAELVALCDFVGDEPTEQVKTMLRKSCDIYLQMINEQGYGYGYGRSLGAHGDTGAIEVLPIAAKIGILSEEEIELAYAYTVKCAERIVEFWFDHETELINMWDKGRTIDSYRNKTRIFEVNLDICMKLAEAEKVWQQLNYADRLPMKDYSKKLREQSKSKLFIYDDRQYKRSLVVIRDQEHVFHLPIINGAHKYYDKSNYLPLPYEPFFIEGTPDVRRPYLIPQLVLKNGTRMMPLSYITDIVESSQGDAYSISYRTEALCITDKEEPEKYNKITATSKYTFESGQIVREDEFFTDHIEEADKLIIEFSTFSNNPLITTNKIFFGEGLIKEFETDMVLVSMENVSSNPSYFTPNGCMNYTFKFEQKITNPQIKSVWKIRY